MRRKKQSDSENSARSASLRKDYWAFCSGIGGQFHRNKQCETTIRTTPPGPISTKGEGEEESVGARRAVPEQTDPKDFYALAEAVRVRAFTVSGLAKGDMMQRVFDSIGRALAEGTSFGQWKKDNQDIWDAQGWTGLRAWRVDNIFRTNVQTAYNVGRYKQMKTASAARPFWQYSAINDSRTRPVHRALHGRVYRHDSPFWDTFYPPNGFRCRCTIKTLSARQVRDRGLEVLEGNGLGDYIEPTDFKTGNKMGAVPLMPDKGFESNPGKEAWNPDLSKYDPILREKLEKHLLASPSYIKYKFAKNIDDARKMAAEAGVYADYTDLDINLANYINVGLVEANALGFQTPSMVKLDAKAFIGANADGVMAYLESEDILLVNPVCNLKSLREDCRRMFAVDFWSSASIHHPVRHEIGHVIHYHFRPLRYLALKKAKGLNSGVVELIKKEVGEYAAKNPLEFVAEVYAGMRSGEKYSEKIMRMYRAYGGR